MTLLKPSFIWLSTVGLLVVTGCQPNQPISNSSGSPIPAPTPSTASPSGHAPQPLAGGQVVEFGPYHLEFVAAPEAQGTHLDLFVQTGDRHSPIPDAQVTVEVQLPDGSVQTLALPYDPEGKHYAGLLPSTAPGDYQVAATALIKGQMAKGRFSFSR